MDRDEVIWKLYEDNRSYARFHEAQRSTATNLILVVSAGLLGLVTFDKNINLLDLPSVLLLSILGIFGSLFSAKQYERVRLHLNRARRYYIELDGLIPEAKIREIKQKGDEDTKKRFPRLSKMRLNYFWVALHLMISAIGFILTIIIIF